MPSDFELERAVEDFLQGDAAKFKKSFSLLIEPANGHEEAPWPPDEPPTPTETGRQDKGNLKGFPLELVISAPELTALDIPEREELVEGVVYTRSLGMIFGPRGCGKTYLALTLANAIATGTTFLSWPVPQARRVLYVDGELPAVDLKARVRSICGSAPSPNLELVSSEFFFSTEKCPLNLTNEVQQRRLVLLLDELGKAGRRPEVIFLDNLSAMSYGTDENSNFEQDSILAFLIQLRHRGFCVVVIHHTGKSGDQRGASRREDFLDFSIKLEDPADGVPSQNARFVLSFSKIRRRVPSPSTLDCELIELPGGGLGWSFEQPPQDLDKCVAVLRFCQTMKPKTQKEMIERLKIPKTTVSRWVGEWRGKGYLDGLKVTPKGAEFLAKFYAENE